MSLRRAAAAILVTAAVAGCQPSGNAGTKASPSASGTAAQSTAVSSDTAGGAPAAIQFAQCVRARGLDVLLAPDGSLVPGTGGPVGVTGGPDAAASGAVTATAAASPGPATGTPSKTLDAAKLAEAKAACAKQVPDYVPPTR